MIAWPGSAQGTLATVAQCGRRSV